MTRQDFQGFCAYCFRHESELGGASHFDQDHFEPKSVNPDRTNDYTNMYWSCKDCNSRQNKGEHWPNSDEVGDGFVFSDSCKYDPENRDYTRKPDHRLAPHNNAGRYTIRILRLNERAEIVQVYEDRRTLHAEYRSRIEEFRLLALHLRTRANQEPSRERLLLELAHLIEDAVERYERFANRHPFTASRLPQPLPQDVLRRALSIAFSLAGSKT
jgi:uncharacterized protein (TIGR02646 family)